jgi:hypothetical protein
MACSLKFEGPQLVELPHEEGHPRLFDPKTAEKNGLPPSISGGFCTLLATDGETVRTVETAVQRPQPS